MKKTIVALVIGASLSVLAGCGQKNGETAIKDGYQAFEKGDYRSANIEFKSILSNGGDLSKSEEIQARLGIAKISLHHRDFDGATTELEKARVIALSDKATDFYIKEIDTLMARAFHRSGAREAILSVDSNSSEIRYYKIASLWSKGELEKLDSILSEMDKSSDFYAIAKNISILSKTPDGKESELVEMKKTGNQIADSEASLLSFNVELSKGDLESAISSLGNYNKENPKDNQRALQYAHLLVENGKIDEARVVLAPLLKSFPKNGMINELNARILYSDGKYKEAISASTLSLVATPDAVIPRLISAYSAAKTENPKEALSNLEFVVDKLPPDHPAQRLYIRLKASEGDFDGLADKALALKELGEGDAELLSGLGLEMVRRGENELAKALAEKVESSGDKTSNLGLLQLSLNEKERAFETLEFAFLSDPNSIEAGNSLATAYLAAKEFEKALDLAKQWVDEGKTVEGKMLKGIVLSRTGRLPEALAFFKSVLTEEPTHFMARAGVIETQVAVGEDEQALKNLTLWVKEDGMLALFRNYTASVQAKHGKPGIEIAAKQFEQWFSQGLVSGDEASYISAQMQFLVGNLDVSLERLKQLSKSDFSKRPDYWLLMTSIYESKKDADSARQGYLKWQEIAPKDPMPLMGEVRILAEQGEYSKAVAALDGALHRFDEKTPGKILRIQLLMKMNKFETMERELNSLPEEVQNTTLVTSLWGVVHARAGQYSRAISEIEPFVSETANEDLFRWLIYAVEREGDQAMSLRFINNQLSKKPDSGLANFLMGNKGAERGDFELAKKHYEKAIKVGVYNPLLLNNLAFVMGETGEAKQGIKLALKAMEMSPNPSYLDTLIKLYIDVNDKDSAKEALFDYVNQGGIVNNKVSELAGILGVSI